MSNLAYDNEPGNLLLAPPSPPSSNLPDNDGYLDDAVDTLLSAPRLSPFNPLLAGDAAPRPFEDTYYYKELQKMSESEAMSCLTGEGFLVCDRLSESTRNARLLLRSMSTAGPGNTKTQLCFTEHLLRIFNRLFGVFRPKGHNTISFSAVPLHDVFITQKKDARITIYIGKARKQKMWVDIFRPEGRAALFKFLGMYIKRVHERRARNENRTADAAVKVLVDRAMGATDHSARNRAFYMGRTKRCRCGISPLGQVESTSESGNTDRDATMETGPGEVNEDGAGEVHGTTEDELFTIYEDPVENRAVGLSAVVEDAREKGAAGPISLPPADSDSRQKRLCRLAYKQHRESVPDDSPVRLSAMIGASN